MGTLDIGLLRQAADEIKSVAASPAVEARVRRVLGQIAAHVVDLADDLEGPCTVHLLPCRPGRCPGIGRKVATEPSA